MTKHEAIGLLVGAALERNALDGLLVLGELDAIAELLKVTNPAGMFWRFVFQDHIDAHIALDRMGAPTIDQRGRTLSVSDRIQRLDAVRVLSGMGI